MVSILSMTSSLKCVFSVHELSVLENNGSCRENYQFHSPVCKYVPYLKPAVEPFTGHWREATQQAVTVRFLFQFTLGRMHWLEDNTMLTSVTRSSILQVNIYSFLYFIFTAENHIFHVTK